MSIEKFLNEKGVYIKNRQVTIFCMQNVYDRLSMKIRKISRKYRSIRWNVCDNPLLLNV